MIFLHSRASARKHETASNSPSSPPAVTGRDDKRPAYFQPPLPVSFHGRGVRFQHTTHTPPHTLSRHVSLPGALLSSASPTVEQGISPARTDNGRGSVCFGSFNAHDYLLGVFWWSEQWRAAPAPRPCRENYGSRPLSFLVSCSRQPASLPFTIRAGAFQKSIRKLIRAGGNLASNQSSGIAARDVLPVGGTGRSPGPPLYEYSEMNVDGNRPPPLSSTPTVKLGLCRD